MSLVNGDWIISCVLSFTHSSFFIIQTILSLLSKVKFQNEKNKTGRQEITENFPELTGGMYLQNTGI